MGVKTSYYYYYLQLLNFSSPLLLRSPGYLGLCILFNSQILAMTIRVLSKNTQKSEKFQFLISLKGNVRE